MTNKSLPWKPRLCVLGVGHVGQSLLRQFGSCFECVGLDVSEKSIKEARGSLAGLHGNRVKLTTDPTSLEGGTHYLIAVPTPIREDDSVNLDFVCSALSTAMEFAGPGCIIVIESSIPVGTTRELLGPFRNVFHCGMSPERIDPGRASPTPQQIPKIVSGLTRRAQKQIRALYTRAYDMVIPVSSPEVAEMMKLYENCFRMINIAYVNEISDACNYHNIDPHEVIGAATTKPFGFLPFHPGLGVGGHCIPANAFYLFSNGRPLPMLERATSLMMNRPKELATSFYRQCSQDLQANDPAPIHPKPRVLIVGLAFKAGQSDLSASPSVSFAKTIYRSGCRRVSFYDPLVQKDDFGFMDKLLQKHWCSSYIDSEFDAVALCVRQEQVDFGVLNQLKRCLMHSYV